MRPDQSVFPYPGGKSLYADWIIGNIPDHSVYVEPFGGAAGVLVNKPPSDVEVYNDYDESVANVFRVLREDGKSLLRRLRNQPFSKADYERMIEERRQGLRPDDDVEWAAREFYLRYAHFGARLEVASDAFRRSTGSDLAGRFRRAVEALDDFRDRFRDVVVECDDWEEIVDSYDGEDTVFYMDPPYPDADKRHYRDHSTFDNSRLVQKLGEIDGRFLLSYGDDPPNGLDKYYELKRETRYTMNRGQDEDEKVGVERLFTNFDPDSTPSFGLSETSDPREW